MAEFEPSAGQPKRLLLALPSTHPRGDLAGVYVRVEELPTGACGPVWLREGGGAYLSRVKLPAHGYWTFSPLVDSPASAKCGLITSAGGAREKRPQDVDIWRFDDGSGWVFDKGICVTAKSALLHLQAQQRAASMRAKPRTSAPSQELGAARGELAEAQQQIVLLRAKCEATRDELATARQEIAALRAKPEASVVSQELDTVRDELAKTRQEITALRSKPEASELNQELDATRGELARARQDLSSLRAKPRASQLNTELTRAREEIAALRSEQRRPSFSSQERSLRAELLKCGDDLQETEAKLARCADASTVAASCRWVLLVKRAGMKEVLRHALQLWHGAKQQVAEFQEAPRLDPSELARSKEGSPPRREREGAQHDSVPPEALPVDDEKAGWRALEAELEQSRVALLSEKLELQALCTKMDKAAAALDAEPLGA